jgi:hypothetical protein
MTRSAWIWISAFFLLGIGLGFGSSLLLVRGGDPVDDRVLGSPGTAPGPEAPTAPKGPSGGDTAETAPAPPEDAPVREMKDGELLGVLSKIRTGRIAPGSGRISGTVKTRDGRPVQGVLVRSTRVDEETRRGGYKRGSGPPAEKDLETQVRELVRRYQRDTATRREALTGADGRYVLTGLAEGKYWLRAYKEGWEIQQSRPSRTWEHKPPATVDFRAKLLLPVPVRVLGPDGSAPERCIIDVRKTRGGRSYSSRKEGWKPGEPVLRLSPGTHGLVAVASDDDTLRSEEVKITLEEGATPLEVTLVLKGAVGMRGSVRLPSGWQIDQLWVRYIQTAAGAEPDLKLLVARGKYVHLDSGEERSFKVTDLEAGTYLVGVTGQSHRILAHTFVEVTDVMAEVSLVVPEFKPEDYVVVRVFGPDGTSLKDVTFQGGMRSAYGNWSSGAMAIPQKDGSFRVLHPQEPRHGGVTGGEGADEKAKCFLTVQSEKHGKREVEYDPATTRDLTVKFQSPAHLEVTIPGYKGSEYVGKLALLLPKRGEKGSGHRAYSHMGSEEKGLSSEGVQSFGPVEPGEYDVVLYLRTSDSWSQQIPIRRSPVSLTAGKNAATVKIPPLYSLTVTFEKAGKNDRIYFSPAEGRRWETWGIQKNVGAEGKLTFENLPEGKYKIQKWGGTDAGTMEVSVPGQTFVAFQAKAVNALRVTVTDPGGVLGQAGLRTGDLIIGMDGMEFQNLTHMQMLLYASMGKEKAKLNLLRDGRTLEIEVEPKKLFNPSSADMGGDVEEVSRD